MKNPTVTAVEARKSLCLMSGKRLCIVIQRSMFQHIEKHPSQLFYQDFFSTGICIEYSHQLLLIVQLQINTSKSWAQSRPESNRDIDHMECSINCPQWQQLGCSKNKIEPLYFVDGPGSGVECGGLVRAECWYILCCCDWCISNCDVPQLTGLSSAGHDSILTLY